MGASVTDRGFEMLLTISDLARKTGESPHVVDHAVGRYGPEPAVRMRLTRFWDDSQLPAVRASLRRTAEKSTNKRRRVANASTAKIGSRKG